ncbi:MAG: SPOR domain-containing protein [Pseudomonadales bacterium]|nr:SPOR domain-containing protein [Pseudomonadales bacterium]
MDRHWVYVPVLTEQGTAPLPERLSQAGFTDHLEMRTDDGSRVVSLGVFRSAGAARRLAARLQAAGFDAHLVIRPQRVARYALRVVAKSPRQAALIGSQRLTDGVRREVCPAA